MENGISDTSVSESTERSDGDRGGVDMIKLGVRVSLVVVVVVVGSGCRARRNTAELQNLQSFRSSCDSRHPMPNDLHNVH
jgi:hypothetical protein